MKKAVVCEKEERKRQRKAALCNLRAKKRWKFWEKRLWILFWLAILRNARTASSTTLWGCTVAGCTDYDVSDGFSDSNTDWKILLFKEERTASCKLYPRSFCDFSSGIGGDIIGFASAVLGLNNWEACRYLIEAFSLPFSLSGHTDNRGRYAAVSRRDSGSRKRNGDLKQRGWQRWTGSRHGRTFISGPLQKRYSLPCLICRHSQSENCRRYLMSWMCFAYMAAGGSRRPY